MEGVLKALADAGWVGDVHRPGEHPLRLTMSRGGQTIRARIYIWSLTHGGGSARPEHEYRIQVTSNVSRFEVHRDEKTIILGWSEQFGVYAAFDVTRHSRPLGSSPSMQISKAALLRAGEVGVAIHYRGRREEIAVAVRPDLLGDYIERLELLHHKGTADSQTEELERHRLPALDTDVEAEAEAQRLIGYVRAGRRPRFGDLNEAKQRQTILARLEALERHVGIEPGRPPQMGHNQPPEPIEEETPEATRNAIADASKAISEEVAKPAPAVEQVAEKTTALALIARGLRVVREESAALGRQVREVVRKRAAEMIVGTVIGGGAILHSPLGAALGSALHSLATWFRMLF